MQTIKDVPKSQKTFMLKTLLQLWHTQFQCRGIIFFNFIYFMYVTTKSIFRLALFHLFLSHLHNVFSAAKFLVPFLLLMNFLRVKKKQQFPFYTMQILIYSQNINIIFAALKPIRNIANQTITKTDNQTIRKKINKRTIC